MRCSQGKSKTALEHALKKAIAQLDSVFFDLRHIKFAPKISSLIRQLNSSGKSEDANDSALLPKVRIILTLKK